MIKSCARPNSKKALSVEPIGRISGKIVLLGDKSIAHRSVIASSLSRGKTLIENFPPNKDCLYTLEAFKKLGIKIARKAKSPNGSISIELTGKGLKGLRKPKGPIFVGDSGTTLRLLFGVLAAQDFETKLVAGSSLSRRPMLRVTAPLRLMGADIKAKTKNKKGKIEEYPPITIRGGSLAPISYKMPVASAQVKSAIILAGLFAKGKTCVIEPVATRDHTERMLRLFGAGLRTKAGSAFVRGNMELTSPKRIYIPADISSASFFIALALILPDSNLAVKNVSLNPTRFGVVEVLKRMGADIRVKKRRPQAKGAEPFGDLAVRSSRLRGTTVKRGEIPSLIDELPILMVAACNAQGKSVFEDVGELRVKETDRVNSLFLNLRKMGADIKIVKQKGLEKIIIHGGRKLKGVRLKSFGDHRTAMSMVVAGLCALGRTSIDDISCISKSFPNFLTILKNLTR